MGWFAASSDCSLSRQLFLLKMFVPDGPGQRIPPLPSVNMQLDVFFIIPSWSTCALLRDYLHSVGNSGGGSAVGLEVIVVDNASHDGSAEMVAAGFPSVRLLQNNANLGFARACNQGIDAGTHRYILLLNSDTLAIDGTFEHMVRFAEVRPEAAEGFFYRLRPSTSSSLPGGQYGLPILVGSAEY
jgi:Glycosyl transferase family 2